jgi:hypothetical protein
VLALEPVRVHALVLELEPGCAHAPAEPAYDRVADLAASLALARALRPNY